MKNYFQGSYEVLMRVFKGDYLKSALKDLNCDENDKAIATKICYGVLDKNIELEYYIKQLVKTSSKLGAKVIIKMGIYSMKYLLIPEYAIVDNAVKLCSLVGKSALSGFVNGVLRNFSRNNYKLPDGNSLDALSLRYSYPKYAVQYLLEEYGQDTTIKIISCDTVKNCVRFQENGETYLKEHNIEYETTPFENVFFVKSFIRNEDFFNGVYTYQSIGSVAICELIKARGIVLDTCSAPGGKSVYMAQTAEKVVALDIHKSRCEKITEYKNRMKIFNIEERVEDATKYNSEFEQKFDIVLCDVLCSGFGVVIEEPDIKLNRKVEDIFSIKKVQKQIIENCKNYVKVGGKLYYSTCTILNIENDNNTEEFLLNNQNFKKIELESPLPHLKTANGLQFLPHISSGTGFYVCGMTRIS